MAKTFRDLMAESRQIVPEWTPDDVRQRTSNGGGYALIDVREKEEYREGHLRRGGLACRAAFSTCASRRRCRTRTRRSSLYCAGGTRSLLAGQARSRTWATTNVVSMSGRLTAPGRAPAIPWVADRQFTAEQLNRYSRHFLLPEVGEAGQAKLLDAKVLLIGAGGLGSPTALLPRRRRRRHARHRRSWTSST